jgi:hypothetical protein
VTVKEVMQPLHVTQRREIRAARPDMELESGDRVIVLAPATEPGTNAIGRDRPPPGAADRGLSVR